MHDPNGPVGRLLFNVLAMIAEFESDLISMRTREGMQLAKTKRRLRGELAELFSVAPPRSTAPSNALANRSPPARHRHP